MFTVSPSERNFTFAAFLLILFICLVLGLIIFSFPRGYVDSNLISNHKSLCASKGIQLVGYTNSYLSDSTGAAQEIGAKYMGKDYPPGTCLVDEELQDIETSCTLTTKSGEDSIRFEVNREQCSFIQVGPPLETEVHPDSLLGILESLSLYFFVFLIVTSAGILSYILVRKKYRDDMAKGKKQWMGWYLLVVGGLFYALILGIAFCFMLIFSVLLFAYSFLLNLL